jgi:hypothetical protein
MGAGISLASNTAKAVAGAYTSVIDNTNVFTDQNVLQNQTVNLDNCDVTAATVGFKMDQSMKQSLNQVGQVKDTNQIANDIAQSMSQAANASVGAGVLGIADTNNTAAVYANMTTNVTNYVNVSADQENTANQQFNCQHSTIVATGPNGAFNLSEMQYGTVSSKNGAHVMNSTDITNSITQSISQTATSSTGMSWWVLLAIVVLVLVAGLIFKLKDSKMKAQHAMDMQQAIELGCCTNSQLDISNIQGGGLFKKTGQQIDKGLSSLRKGFGQMFSGPNMQSYKSQKSGACQGCDCYQLMHPEAHVSKAIAILYFVGVFLIGALIPLWYVLVAGRACLYNAECTNNSGGNFTGCSCNFAVNSLTNSACKDTVTGTLTSNGLPRKYQYALFVSMKTPGKCDGDVVTSQASLQGMLISILKTVSSTKNSNNGKNLDTLQKYMAIYGWPSTPVLKYNMPNIKSSNTLSIQVMYQSCIRFLNSASKQDYPTLQAVYSAHTDPKQIVQAGLDLFMFLCPLRPAFFSDCDPDKVLTASDSDSGSNINFMSRPNTTASVNWIDNNASSTTYGVTVPGAFRYGANASGGGTGNPDAGCCSLHSMSYSTDASAPKFNDRCGSGTSEDCASAFCSGNNVPDKDNPGNTCSDGSMKFAQTSDTMEAMMGLPPKPTSCDGVQYTDITTLGENDPINYYAEWTFFDTDKLTDKELGLIRLLWSGTFAYMSGYDGDSIWGVNAVLVLDEGQESNDHFYVKTAKDAESQNYGQVGSAADDSSASILNDPTLLTIKPTEDLQYDVLDGLRQAKCVPGGVPFSGQGYTATAKKIGYCKSGFFNRITLYTIIGFLIFWILLLPIFLIVRWYVNKGVSAKYLAASRAQYSSRKRSFNQNQTQNQTQPQNKVAKTSQPTNSQTMNHPLADQQSLEVQSQSLETTAPPQKASQSLKNKSNWNTMFSSPSQSLS